MFLQITHSSGSQVYSFDRPVVRVGSDEACLVPLPSGHAAHALTIERLEGGARVHNRLDEPITLGGQSVEPGDSADWSISASLTLAAGVQMQLLAEAPTDDAAGEADDYPDEVDESPADEDDSPASGKKSSSQTTQLAVIALCVMVGLACMMGSGGTDSSEEQALSFAEVVTLVVDDEGVPPKLLQRLQHAEAGVVRGDRKQAEQRYNKLRDILLDRRENQGDESSEGEQQILRFVEQRLSKF